MKITILGATGDVGSRLVKEALSRGHNVRAVMRRQPEKPFPNNVETVLSDIKSASDIVRVAAGQDALFCALRPPAGHEQILPDLTNHVLDGAAETGVRVLFVGGAGSLKIPDSPHTVLTAPNFLPEGVVPIARASYGQYERVMAHSGANWTYLCPAAMLQPGKRTGAFTLGTNTLVTDKDGNSAISMEDLAVALLDETETPAHQRRRFTLGYTNVAA